MKRFKFCRQRPFGYYVLDFVCLEARLVIEVDRGQHSERQAYDQRKIAWLEAQGFPTLRFWNHKVLHYMEEVNAAIWQVLPSDLLPPSPLFS